MLVSSIARFNALNTMSNAAMASMQTTNSMLAASNASAFGGEHDLALLNEMDKKLSIDLASNSLLNKLAYFQEKMLSKHKNNEIKKSLDTFA